LDSGHYTNSSHLRSVPNGPPAHTNSHPTSAGVSHAWNKTAADKLTITSKVKNTWGFTSPYVFVA